MAISNQKKWSSKLIKLICDNTKEIRKNQKKLEKELSVKISISGRDVNAEGNAEDEYLAEKVLDALCFGFSAERALMIRKEGFIFEILNIKDYTRRKDMSTIKSRIIGKGGKTLRALSTLTECNFEIKGNDVGILGSPECIKSTHEAVISLIRGAKQANVYSFLEKNRAKPVFDLGLKEGKNKQKKVKE